MTCREKLKLEHPEYIDSAYGGGCFGCPEDYGYHTHACDYEPTDCKDCWNREIPGTEKAEESTTPRILDSGDRTEFASGAVRDMREGKGRCDLLPLDVIRDIYSDHDYGDEGDSNTDAIFGALDSFCTSGNPEFLFDVLSYFDRYITWVDMLLEVAKHFEEGAKKYGDDNWRKGIPVRCYIDSAIRHYLKYLRGDKDEPHDRAFVWNILCCIWTCKHKPELNEYTKETK